MRVHIYVCVFIYSSWLCPLRRAGSSNTPGAMRSPNTRVLASKYHAPVKGTRAPWRKELIPGLGAGTVQELGTPVVPASKKVLKEWG